MKKNYRKPLMKLHAIKFKPIMLDVSGNSEETSTWGDAKERNAGDWEEF